MDKFIEKYIAYLKTKELSKNSIEAYGRDLKKFNTFLKEREEEFREIETVTLMAYVQHLQKQGKATSSILRSVASIRGFYKYLGREQRDIEDPTYYYEAPKAHRNIPETLTIEEVDRLLAQPVLTTDLGLRDKAMLELIYATGLKVTELLNLTIYDLQLKHAYIRCVDGKEKERNLPIGSHAIHWLEAYLTIREHFNRNHLDLLFFNSKGGKMTRQGFWKLIKQYATEAKIQKRINASTLRHSFAVHLLQNGAEMKAVQELLGHQSLSATQIYNTITKKSKLAEVYKKAHPRA